MTKLLLVLVTTTSLAAQNNWDDVTRLKPGSKVMVSYAKGFAEGPLVEATADRVVVKSAGKDVTAARVDVKKLWVPANKRGRNTLIGAAIGVGAALLPALGFRSYLNNETGNGDQAAAATLAIGAGAGAGLGALNRGRTLIYRR